MVSVINRIIEAIKFYKIKRIFNKICRLVVDNANNVDSEKESFSDAKGRDQWGPGLMVTKRPEGWPSFQHHGL